MYDMLTKNGQAIAFGLGALIIAIFVILAGTSGMSGLTDEQLLAPDAKVLAIMFGIFASFALVVLCLVGMLGFGLFQMLSDLKGSLKGLIGVGAIIVFFILGYALSQPIAEGTPLYEVATHPDFNITDGVSKLIDGGLYAALITLGAALVIAVVMEVLNIFK